MRLGAFACWQAQVAAAGLSVPMARFFVNESLQRSPSPVTEPSARGDRTFASFTALSLLLCLQQAFLGGLELLVAEHALSAEARKPLQFECQ